VTSAGTAFIPFEGDFSKVLVDARKAAGRAGTLFGNEFGDTADGKVGASWKRTSSGMVHDAGRAGSRSGSDFSSEFGAKAERSMGGTFRKLAAGATAVFAGAKVVDLFGDMISEGRESAKVGRITENAIRATGGAANTTAADIGNLSTALSNKAGIDDEVIQTGANLLLTFKQVRNEVGKGNDVFDRAVSDATDLSVQFGSVDSASKMLGKALNDPVKGMSALSRAGVTFTDQQKAQAKAMVGANDVLGAQKIILGEVESQVGGAAAAAADPIDRLKVAWGNLLELGGTKILPWIDDVAEGLVDKLPGALDTVQDSVSGLVTTGVDLAEGLWTKVEPAASDVADTLGHLVKVGSEVIDTARPMAEGLALVGGSVVIGGIKGTAAALEMTSGFLADNEGLVRALTTGVITFAALKAWGLIVANVETIYLKWLYLEGAVVGSAIGETVGLIGTGFVTMGTNASLGAGMVVEGLGSMAAALGPAAAVGAVVAIGLAWTKAGDDAEKSIEKMKPLNFDESSLASVREYAGTLNSAYGKATEAQKTLDDGSSWDKVRTAIKGTAEAVSPMENSVLNTYHSTEKLKGATEEWNDRVGLLQHAYTDVFAAVSKTSIPPGKVLGLDSPALAYIDAWVAKLNLDPAKMPTAQLTSQIMAAATAAEQGTPKSDALGGSFKVLADQTSNSTDKLDAWRPPSMRRSASRSPSSMRTRRLAPASTRSPPS